MLKTLNTITSLISNEGVTSAVANSLQALARSLEAQVDRARDDFARLLENRLQAERHRYEQVVATGRDQVKRVDDALDALRMRGGGELSAVERLDRVVGAVRTDVTDMRRATNEFSARLDRLEAAGPTDEQTRQDTVEYLEAVLTELKDDWVATLRGIETRLDKLEAQVAVLVSQSAAPCEGVNELRDQIEDVAVRAEMRFKSFDNVWQDLARSVSALASKVAGK